MVRGVIFDLGGTLAAPENHLADDALDRLNAGGLLRWLRQRGLQVDGDFVEALVDERRANEVKRARVASEVTAVDALRPVLQRYHLPHADGFISEAEVAFFQPELRTMRPLPGAPEILTRLRALGLRAGLASTHPQIISSRRAASVSPLMRSWIPSCRPPPWGGRNLIAECLIPFCLPGRCHRSRLSWWAIRQPRISPAPTA